MSYFMDEAPNWSNSFNGSFGCYLTTLCPTRFTKRIRRSQIHENSLVEQYWRNYLKTLEPEDRASKSYDTWHFGDTEKLANELAELVKTGEKTATSVLVWQFEDNGWKFPTIGDIVIVTDWNGNPSCIIEITEVEVRAFDEIDERFVFDYGEGDKSLAWWRRGMWGYYSKLCRKIGREPTGDMPLSCQRFRLVFK